jgi:hypothetical protein
VQDGARQAGVVGEAGRRHDGGLGKMRGLDQPLALERHPHRAVLQAGGVLGHDHRTTQMKMIAMRRRRAADQEIAILALGTAVVGNTRQRLKQGQGLELQMVEIERVVFGRHVGRILKQDIRP